MNARYRMLLEQRFGERQRQHAFALAATVLLAATITLNGLGRPDPSPTPPPAARTMPRPASAPASATPATPTSRPRVQPRPDRRLRRTAKRFLAGYLPYLYGQAPLRRIEGASRELRRRLARSRLHVPPAARRRRPRVRTLRLGGRVPDAHAWRVTARIADGGIAVYPIELLIAMRRGRAVVIETGGE